ncbi:MAG: replication initiator protein [Microviridae sp.]|nr:MAG: replication initiator protein [Microviridae sp.]
MSCFHPRVMACRVSPSGAVSYKFIGLAESGYDPFLSGDISTLSSDGSYHFLVPCRKCLGCQIDYSREWRDRMIFELHDNPKAIFLTLTYNDEHLTFSNKGCPTLVVADVQKFMKRLRKHFNGTRIRFYLAGEYGSRNLRPHYHAIIYGIDLSDFPDLYPRGYNELKQAYYSSPTMEKIWKNGFIIMSEVTSRTCAYVARYVTKKQGNNSVFHVSRETLPEFNLSSRNPGLGLLNSRDYVMSGNNMFSFDGRDGSISVSLPKSMLRNVRRTASQKDLDIIDDIVYNRSMDAAARLRSNLQSLDLDFGGFIKGKERALTSKIKLLPERNV